MTVTHMNRLNLTVDMSLSLVFIIHRNRQAPDLTENAVDPMLVRSGQGDYSTHMTRPSLTLRVQAASERFAGAVP